MDIKTLRYFLTVAQEKNITRAAEKLFLAQPPLSRQMKLLEQELGVTLFIRGKRQIRLTEEGYYLKQQAEEIIYLLEKTEQHLKRMGYSENGIISIGATGTCCISIVAELIEQFHKIAPHIRFRTWTGDGDEIQEKLDKNLVDIGIVREPVKMENYDRVFLHSEPWGIICNAHHPLAQDGGDGIELSALENVPLIVPSRQSIQDEINGWFNLISADRNIFCFYNSISSVLELAERNVGVIICPENIRKFVNKENLAYKQIVNPLRESRVYIVKNRMQVMSAALERFWQFALDYAKKHIAP